MSVFVLVHGACHGGWCWFKVRPLLEQLGHVVHCPDLPGHGRDRTPLSEISLNAYAAKIAEVLKQQSEPAVLVGHSLGGLVISETARLTPTHIDRLIYLTAFHLQDHETVHQIVAQDEQSLLFGAFEIDSEQQIASLRPDAVEPLFYQDCSPADLALAQSLLVPVSMRPHDETLTSASAAARCCRHYIECTLDNTITLDAQRRMHANLPANRVWTLETGHSPFFSAPDQLAQLLHRISGASD